MNILPYENLSSYEHLSYILVHMKILVHMNILDINILDMKISRSLDRILDAPKRFSLLFRSGGWVGELESNANLSFQLSWSWSWSWAWQKWVYSSYLRWCLWAFFNSDIFEKLRPTPSVFEASKLKLGLFFTPH